MSERAKLRVLSLGAGVQSSTLALMSARGELPVVNCAIFADTQGEPQAVYDYLGWLESVLPFPVYRVTKGNLWESASTPQRTRDGERSYISTGIPVYTVEGLRKGKGKRQCTRTFKVEPVTRRVRELVGPEAAAEWRSAHKDDRRALANYHAHMAIMRRQEKAKRPDVPGAKLPLYYAPIPYPQDAYDRLQSHALVEMWIGISYDEVDRMKPSRAPWIRAAWPLVDAGMTRADCLAWMAQHDYPEPPRSACVFCPFRDDDSWLALSAAERDDAAAKEQQLQAAYARTSFRAVPFLHDSRVPLPLVKFQPGRPNMLRDQLTLTSKFRNECEGMCGV